MGMNSPGEAIEVLNNDTPSTERSPASGDLVNGVMSSSESAETSV